MSMNVCGLPLLVANTIFQPAIFTLVTITIYRLRQFEILAFILTIVLACVIMFQLLMYRTSIQVGSGIRPNIGYPVSGNIIREIFLIPALWHIIEVEKLLKSKILS